MVFFLRLPFNTRCPHQIQEASKYVQVYRGGGLADWCVQSGRSLIIIKSTSNTKITQVTTFPTTMPLTSSTHNPALLKVSGLEIGGSRNHHYHLHYAGDQDCNSVNLLERSGRRRHCFFGDWPCSQTQVSIVLMAMVISMAKRI